jgi:pimeloyl-ACP methyl ester carboxylesterase
VLGGAGAFSPVRWGSILSLSTFTGLPCPVPSVKIRTGALSAQYRMSGKYIDAGGVRTYYEEHGEGQPLVMLHGDLFNLENFKSQVEVFATKFRVITPERRGHGRTFDISAPYTYQAFADDAIAFIEALGLTSVNLLGHSGGASIALLATVKRPDLVDRLVYISGEYKSKTTEEQKMEVMASTQEDFFRKVPLHLVESIQRVMPKWQEGFPNLWEKMKEAFTTDWEVTNEQLVSIKAPTLVMSADRDYLPVEDAVFLFRSLPNAQLFIVPGADHGLLAKQADRVNPIIMKFLESVPGK